MVLGLGGLLAIPKPLEEPKPMFARTRAADLAQVPCSSQTWPMVERRCQAWTAARPGDSKNEEAAPKKEEVARRPDKIEPPVQAVMAERPVVPPPVRSESRVEVRVAVAEPAQKPADLPPPQPASEALAQAQSPAAAPRPSADRAPKPRKAEKPRESSRESIQVTVQASDRSRRTITIKPTSQQDAMYYAARPNVGIGGSFAVR